MRTEDGPTSPVDFKRINLDALRQAIDLYLELAYSSSRIPAAVTKRLQWDTSEPPDILLHQTPFEKVGQDEQGASIVALRLGNARYPNMKLQIQPWDTSQGFLLSVNTHDQITLDPKAPDAQAFRALQAENQRLKSEIEQAWDRAGLPTFLRYLLDYLASHQNDTP